MQHNNYRMHMQSKDFEVFHYNNDYILNNVGLHDHDCFEISLFLSGNAYCSIENQNHPISPGDILLISPFELHQPQISPGVPYDRIVLWINKTFLEQSSSPQTDLTACFATGSSHHNNLPQLGPTQREEIQRLMMRLCHEAGNQKYGGDIFSNCLLKGLLVEINRAAQPIKHETAGPDIVSSVLNYINEHYNERLSLDLIASKFFISKYYLSHEFNRAVGTSVYRYIIQKRLQIAKEMLSNGVPPTAVCQHCGFTDYANFYRAFKSAYGITPQGIAMLPQTRDSR